jgi:PhnB protein
MTQTKPRPEGQHTIIPHLIVRGAANAIEFYKKAFGAVEQMRMDMPDGKIGHACLKIGDSPFFLCDEFPGEGGGCKSPQSLGGSCVTIHLNVDDADAVFARAVAAGAKATMPPADMFWGDRYAKVVDPFGHDWSLSTHKEDVSPEEMKKRGQAMFAETAKKKQ